MREHRRKVSVFYLQNVLDSVALIAIAAVHVNKLASTCLGTLLHAKRQKRSS